MASGRPRADAIGFVSALSVVLLFDGSLLAVRARRVGKQDTCTRLSDKLQLLWPLNKFVACKWNNCRNSWEGGGG